MSKRPKTTDSVLSRLPIWSKIGLVMLLPIIATVVVVTNSALDNADSSNNADQTRGLGVVVQASGDLVQNLQDERAAAAKLLGVISPSQQERYRTDYEAAQSAVQRVAGDYTNRAASRAGLPADVTNVLRQVDEGLQGLPDVRSGVAGGRLAFTDSARAYNAVIDNLLQLRDNAAKVAVDPALNQRMRAAAAIARQKEYLSQERLVVLQAYAAGGMNENLEKAFIAAQTGQLQMLETFFALATATGKEQYTQSVAGTVLRASVGYAGWVTGTMPPSGELTHAPFSIDTWDAALLGHGELIRGVEQNLDGSVVDTARAVRDDGQRRLLVEAGVPLAILLLALLVAWLVVRSMNRSRREPQGGSVVSGGPVDPDRPLAMSGSGDRDSGRR